MGEVNKLTLEINGIPLLKHCVQIYLQSNLHSLYIVVGYEADWVRSILQGLAVTFVENSDYEQGQMSSVHAGLCAVESEAQAVMICLSDQALLQVEDINSLIDHYEQSAQDKILIPTHKGQRGNPIIIPESHVSGIKQGNRNLGCKRFIQKNPQLTVACEMENDHVVVDIDTPENYIKIKERAANGT